VANGLHAWIEAARPRTLPAAAAPVLLGSALAFAKGCFLPLPAGIALAFALLIQVGTNFANDYYDARKGADTPERLGPTRAVAAGLIAPGAMRAAALVTLALAFCVGLTLVYWGGWWLVAVGVLSVVCALAYTGGPFPLAYLGLGDVFVFLFFGLVAVMFTEYVQCGTFSLEGLLLGAGCGLLSNNLLVVNNYRDIETDRAVGKRTLPVRFGRVFARVQYLLSNRLALLLAVGVAVLAGGTLWVFLVLLALPLMYGQERRLGRAVTREQFGRVLAGTAGVLVLYAVLATIGLVLPA